MNKLEAAAVVLVVWGIALVYFGAAISSASGRSDRDNPTARVFLTLGILCGVVSTVLAIIA